MRDWLASLTLSIVLVGFAYKIVYGRRIETRLRELEKEAARLRDSVKTLRAVQAKEYSETLEKLWRTQSKRKSRRCRILKGYNEDRLKTAKDKEIVEIVDNFCIDCQLAEFCWGISRKDLRAFVRKALQEESDVC